MILRPYQLAALARARAAYRAGARAIALVAPTGAGKTIIAAELVRSHLTRADTRALVIVPRLELATQTAAVLRGGGIPGGGSLGQRTGIMSGAAAGDDLDADAPVQVATIQTLQRRGVRPRATMVIPDELHHYVSDEWMPVVSDYRAAGAVLLGLTATPCRSDGRALSPLFDSLLEVASVAELTRAGHLVPCTVFAPARRLQALAEDPVRAYLERGCNARGSLRRALVFAASVDHGHAIAESLRAAGVTAAAIDGAMAESARRSVLDAHRGGELDVVVNCQLLTEGYDDPALEMIVLARGVSHAGTWIQIIGRALRPAPGKTEALVIDLLGSVHDHGLPEDARTYSLEGKPIVLAETTLAIRQCPACGGVYRAEEFAASTCPRCGYALPARKDPRIRREELMRIRATHTPPARAAAWRALLDEAERRGFKPGWAWYRFHARYGRAPPGAT